MTKANQDNTKDNKSSHGILSGAGHIIGNVAGTAYHAASTAIGIAESAAGTVLAAAGNVENTVFSTVQTTGETLVDSAGNVAHDMKNVGVKAGQQGQRHLARATNTLRRRAGVVASSISPIVNGQGADFGDLDPTKEPVILRIEIAQSSEAKLMTAVSWLMSLFAIAALIFLTIIKFEVQGRTTIIDSNYFMPSVIVCAILLVILLYTAVIFIRRMHAARKCHLQWSRRRLYFSIFAFVILMLQSINVIITLANAAFVTPRDCGWKSNTFAILGYIGWTLWVCEFFIIIVMAHCGCVWQGRVFKTSTAKNGSRKMKIFQTIAERQKMKTAVAATSDDQDDDLDKDKLNTLAPISTHDAGTICPALSQATPTTTDIDQAEKGRSGNGIDGTIPSDLSLPPITNLALVLDAPITVHAPKLLLWAFLQIIITFMFVRTLEILKSGRTSEFGCTPGTVGLCNGKGELAPIVLSITATALFLCVYVYYSWRSRRDIQSRPYAETRFARMVFGVQFQQVMPVLVTQILGCILLLSVEYTSCWTYVETWMGNIPLQAVGTAMAVILAFFYMPKQPKSSEQILQAWLQEFAWSQSTFQAVLETRNAKLIKSRKLSMEPMFCFETAIKLLYFANIVYSLDSKEEIEMKKAKKEAKAATVPKRKLTAADSSTKSESSSMCNESTSQYDEAKDNFEDSSISDAVTATAAEAAFEAATRADANNIASHHQDEEEDQTAIPGFGDIETALSLYNLTHHEIIYEPETDTKALLAWNDELLLAAFKGTSSFENIKTDLNIFKVIHPPHRYGSASTMWGLRYIPASIKVHKGFYTAWVTNDYDQRILNRMDEIINSSPYPWAMKLMVTGHSLGGALATLAAHAITTKFKNLSAPTVYTYGEPRVGNQPFAQEYNTLIPDHFCIVNGQDPVSRIPPGWYKRVGVRVLLNNLGDIIVRPTYLEMQLINTAGGEVKDHFLESYRTSLMRIIKNQFTKRRLKTGQPGAYTLSLELDLDKALIGKYLDAESLKDAEIHPISQEEEYRNERKLLKNASQGFSLSCGGNGGVVSCGCCGGGSGVWKDSSTHHEEHKQI